REEARKSRHPPLCQASLRARCGGSCDHLERAAARCAVKCNHNHGQRSRIVGFVRFSESAEALLEWLHGPVVSIKRQHRPSEAPGRRTPIGFVFEPSKAALNELV